MNTISLKLPQPLLDRLEEEARLRRQSKSAIVRECLTEALLKPGRKKQVSCLDLAGDLVGSVSGPRDLSTNKDYLMQALTKEQARERKRSG
jgi:Arc/MetJ-type ribon-helix-helix transcriptional regulator